MIISRMSRFMGKHGRTVFIIIGILIVFPFVFLWRMPGRGNLFRKALESDVAVRMYGKAVRQAEFLRQMKYTDISVFLQTNGYFQPSRNNRLFNYWVRETLRRMRAMHEARRLGLDKVSDSEVAAKIRGMLLFQKDGEFSEQSFRRFCDGFLASQGLSPSQFDQIVREDIIVDRLDNMVRAQAFVSPTEVRQRYDRMRQKLKISRCDFRYYQLMRDVKIEPTPKEIESWFAAHKSGLRLPDRVRVRLAVCSPKSLEKKITVTEKELRAYYEKHKSLYSVRLKKSFDQAKALIRRALLERNAQIECSRRAGKLVKSVRKAWEKSDKSKPPKDIFTAECRKLGMNTVDTAPFARGFTEIPKLGKLPNVIRRASKLTRESPFSRVIVDSGKFYVACWLETVPGPHPTRLDSETRRLVIEKIQDRKARDFYAKHVEKFRAMLQGGKTPDDLIQDYSNKVDNMKEKSDDEKAELKRAFENEITQYLVPYFHPTKKKIEAAVFSPADFVKKVKLSSGDLKQYYDSHKAEYARKQVQLRHILLRFPPKATASVKNEIRKKLEGIRRRIAAGAAFADMAKKYSQDSATRAKGGDMGFVALDSLPKESADIVKGLDPGQISGVVTTKKGCELIQKIAERDYKPFDEVKSDIRKKLIEEKSKQLAREAASKFADKVYDALGERKGTEAAAVFESVAAAMKIPVKKSDWFRKGGYIPPFGFESALAKQAFDLNEERPLSETIQGKKDFFVACWVGTQKSYLPRYGKDKSLKSRVLNQIRREKALDLAREKAKKAYAAISKKLARGIPFAKAAAGYKFADIPEFTPERPPMRQTNMQEIIDALAAVPARTLLPPIETVSGSALVYLKSRTLPSDEQFKKDEKNFTAQVKRRKEQALLQAFWKRLEKESNTQLAKRWQPRRRGRS